MRTVFYIGPRRDEWCLELFPGKSPAELQIAGKSWCRHAVDFCSLLGVSDIYVADCFFRKELSGQLGNGDFWSLRLHYPPCFPCARVGDLLGALRNELPDSDDLLFFWGTVLPDVSDAKQILEHLRPVEREPDVLPDGIWLRRDGKLFECGCPLFRMDTLKQYFDLNFRLLEQPGLYNLPGYSSRNGCSIGMDVIIMLNCELEQPVIIQDKVCLERGVRLHNGVIIGKDVLVDENSELDHSIILNHTYIGKNMCFRNKIVDGNRVIDVEHGAMVELEDRFLSGSTRDNRVSLRGTAEWLMALALAIGLLPLYLFSLLFGRLELSKLAFFQFLHRVYPMLFPVLGGRANLVRYGQGDRMYAFRYSDMWPLHQDASQKKQDDIYFYYHRTVSNIAKVVVLSLLKRFFMLSSPERAAADGKREEER